MAGELILFQGDSITDGWRGVNTDDKNRDMGQSYAFIVAAALGVKHPERAYRFMNRGVSGNTCANICGRWQEETMNYRPDVISLLAGINDVGREARAPEGLAYHGMAAALELLLTQTRAILPSALLVLMEPFMLDAENHPRDIYAKRAVYLADYQQVVRKAAAAYGAVFVPLQRRFELAAARTGVSYWLWDSVHPTYAGHGLIADAWMQDVAPALAARA